MKEVIIVPTYKRNHFLWCALDRIRKQDRRVKIMVFSDRGLDTPELRQVAREFDASVKITPRHDYYGNSYSTMEAFRWAVDCGFDLIHLNEDDAMQHEDCLQWHRDSHEEYPDLFAACGWVFNSLAPIGNADYFVRWYYSPNSSFRRDMLALVTQHACPLYYNSMQEYVRRTFDGSPLFQQENEVNQYYEQDAVVQFELMKTDRHVRWNRTAKVDHVGAFGYNKPNGPEFLGTLEERVAQVEDLIADHAWRAHLFGKERVEREIGHEIETVMQRYLLRMPSGFVTEFATDLPLNRIGNRINSARVEEGSVFEKI